MCTSAVTPCCARQARAQCSGQPSMARMGRPELALLTSELTRPPTPAMQDISASPARSRRTARVLASCATLEQPEQEYTSGSLDGLGMGTSWQATGAVCGRAFPAAMTMVKNPRQSVAGGNPFAWRLILVGREALAVEYLDAPALHGDHAGVD